MIGGSPAIIVSVVTVLILILMIIVGIVMLAKTKYDGSWTKNISVWGGGLLAVGLLGLTAFGVGIVAGKSSSLLRGVTSMRRMIPDPRMMQGFV
jgi:L-asparagine transporter-like permease